MFVLAVAIIHDYFRLGMKAKYVNVLSQSTTPSNTNLPPPGMMDYSKTQVPPNMKLFVPSSGRFSRKKLIYGEILWLFLVMCFQMVRRVCPMIYRRIPIICKLVEKFCFRIFMFF